MAIQVVVPPLGTNVDALILTAWLVNEGESVVAGQPLFSVETDKATLDVESPGDGILSDVSAKAGDEVRVLSRIANLLSEEEASIPDFTVPGDEGDDEQLELRDDSEPFCKIPVPQHLRRRFASPRARRLAEVEGIDWRYCSGSGPEGAIVERDIRAALGGPLHPQASYSHSLPLSGTRAVIAERMMASASSAALVTLTAEVDATDLVEARQRVNAAGLRVSFTDFLAWLLGKALIDHPRLNTRLDGDFIRYGGPVHLGIAVDTDRGLLVPVLRDVQRKSLSEIAVESADLIRAVREGRASPESLRGSTFTLTNLGGFGIDAFTPLPNLPEGAVLGVGRIKASPAVVDGVLCVRQHVWLSLTFDHCLLDGAPAARFLRRLSEMIQDRELLSSL